ncbi:TPA: ead/Ea22-like family protein [Klebsiella pneumoniae]
MKTDITEMAQSLKAAAEKATPGQWRRASTQFNGITATPFMLGRKEAMIAGVSEKRDAEFIAMANPANVLALVEALEKAQDTINEMDNRIRKQNRHVCELFDDNTALRQRIAELESRTVTVKQYDEFQICHYGATEDYAKGYIDCQNNFSKWLTAAGIK